MTELILNEILEEAFRYKRAAGEKPYLTYTRTRDNKDKLQQASCVLLRTRLQNDNNFNFILQTKFWSSRQNLTLETVFEDVELQQSEQCKALEIQYWIKCSQEDPTLLSALSPNACIRLNSFTIYEIWFAFHLRENAAAVVEASGDQVQLESPNFSAVKIEQDERNLERSGGFFGSKEMYCDAQFNISPQKDQKQDPMVLWNLLPVENRTSSFCIASFLTTCGSSLSDQNRNEVLVHCLQRSMNKKHMIEQLRLNFININEVKRNNDLESSVVASCIQILENLEESLPSSSDWKWFQHEHVCDFLDKALVLKTPIKSEWFDDIFEYKMKVRSDAEYQNQLNYLLLDLALSMNEKSEGGYLPGRRIVRSAIALSDNQDVMPESTKYKMIEISSVSQLMSYIKHKIQSGLTYYLVMDRVREQLLEYIRNVYGEDQRTNFYMFYDFKPFHAIVISFLEENNKETYFCQIGENMGSSFDAIGKDIRELSTVVIAVNAHNEENLCNLGEKLAIQLESQRLERERMMRIISIRTGIISAVNQYKSWMSENNPHNAQPSRRSLAQNGYFTWLRHTSRGVARAETFLENITNVRDEAELTRLINNEIAQGPLHRHSFISYLIDELRQIQNSPWQAIVLPEGQDKYVSQDVYNTLGIAP